MARARPRRSERRTAVERCDVLQALGDLLLGPGERLGDRPIGRITEDDLETAFRHLSKLAGSTWNKYRQTILHLQKWGRRKGYLQRAWLSEDCELGRKKGSRRDRRLVPDTLDKQGRVAEPGEERRLLAKASPWLKNLIIAALESCCRRGELLSLQWRDVDLERGRIRIRAENAKDGETRDLPILPRLEAVLKHVQHDPAGQKHPPLAFVFGDRIGGRISDPKKSWLACCRKAGIADLHFHDLRHEAASRLLEQGWPLHHVQNMLGHADAKTTSIHLNVTFTQLADSARRFPGPARPSLHDVAQPDDPSVGRSGNGTRATEGNVLVN